MAKLDSTIIYGKLSVNADLEVRDNISATGNLALGVYSTTVQGQLILNGSTVNKQSILKCTDGNLHIDSNSASGLYLNYYSGTSGIKFGNGASGSNANISASGIFSAPGGNSTEWNTGYDHSQVAHAPSNAQANRSISDSVTSTSTTASASSKAAKSAYDRAWPDTTYSVGDGGLTTKNFTSTLKTKLDGIETSATADQTSVSGSSGSCTGNSSTATTASKCTINSSGSASLYNMLWNSGTTIYGEAGVRVQPSTDSLFASGNVIAYYSDERLKEITGPIENAVEKVLSLDVFFYVENDLAKSLGYNNTQNQIGLSAQQVQKILPEIVALAPIDTDMDDDGNLTSKSGENYLTVDYAKITPLLVAAIQEQQSTIENQQKMIDKQNNIIKSLI